jgi:endo-1,4-beta-xylanase
MFSRRHVAWLLLLLISSALVRAQPLAAGHGKFLGSIYSTSQAVNFTTYFNQVTPENAGKWGSVEGTRNVMNWTELDAAYQLAKANGFPFRFHVLVWGNQQPTWIAALPQAEQLTEIQQWFDAVAARYPNIDYLEVVNEPTNDPPDGPEDGGYINALGTSTPGAAAAVRWDWIVKAYRMAREKFPVTTKLVINEYNVTNGSKLQEYLQIINLLKTENLVDVVGVQAHSFSTTINFTSTATTKTSLDALAATGLPIMVTEWTSMVRRMRCSWRSTSEFSLSFGSIRR